MSDLHLLFRTARNLVVGSFGGPHDLHACQADAVAAQCDLAEVRLDLLQALPHDASETPWQHLGSHPLLFTARREEEGGAMPLTAARRAAMLEEVLDQAAAVDIEVASIDEMSGLIEQLADRGIPWIASFHDFLKLPEPGVLSAALERARVAGAAVFKVAAHVDDPAAVARLAEFQLQAHGMPVASMGMGPLAPVSRLLCAQCGSLLNYGYLGETPTAPGQWSAKALRQAISGLAPFTT